ncbi:glycosyltransferase family 2 protein [Priestia aryabhattai]|jgi:glycosyltransferase involved in cell wall biosynthesis|uniref:glycosyltransferase family 2 protein n=1 Tax=Priestia aryabhattai TaxID=412384 RepID=UPI000C06BB69|nr:glycosyltransferase [Priestia aryabhattai]
MPAISIIVPIYNVEKYLHKCVDSILDQTFKDFELILVNDGSPDNCGEICNEYSRKDPRVKVIHKKNGGLSDARNAGIDIAEGDYIGFVDSDDWIEPDMYEILFNMCKTNNCEIGSCTYAIYHQNKRIINESHPLTVHNNKQAMEAMLNDELYNEVVCTKLFKRSLFNGLRFTLGIIHEDTAFTYKAIHKCEKICFIGVPKYNYIKRDDSIMANTKKNVRIDSVLIYEEMYQFIKNDYPQLCDLVALKLTNCSMLALNLMINSNSSNYKTTYYKVVNIMNNYFFRTIKLKNYPFSVKLLLVATKIHPVFYKLIMDFVTLRNKNSKSA